MLGRFGQLLRAVANGPDPAKIPPPSEVIPTIDLAAGRPDWNYPQSVFRFGGYALEAASGGASRSQVCLWLPASSHITITVEEIQARHESHTLLITHAEAALASNDGSEHAMDSRVRRGTYNTRKNTAYITSQQTSQQGTIVTRIFAGFEDAAGIYYFKWKPGFVLFPGCGLNVCGSADDMLVHVEFIWTEREFDNAELRGVRPGLFT